MSAPISMRPQLYAAHILNLARECRVAFQERFELLESLALKLAVEVRRYRRRQRFILQDFDCLGLTPLGSPSFFCSVIAMILQ